MPQSPEDRACKIIEDRLAACGWTFRDKSGINLTAAHGVAMCGLALGCPDADNGFTRGKRELVPLPECQKQFQRASGSSAQAHLFTNSTKKMHVPLPPPAEQSRIVAELEQRLSLVEELESTVSANLQRAVSLRQSILQTAFTGELV